MRPALAVFVLVAGALAASMPLYALVSRAPQDADARRKGSRFLLGAGDFLLHWFLWLLGPLERGLLRAGAGPDALNAAGLALGALAGLLIGAGQLEAGGWAIALSGVCDILDGRLARARGLTSAYGKFVDSTLDRFVETFAFLGLAVYFRQDPVGCVVVAAALAGSLLVSYAQARGETVGVADSGGLMQRAERLVATALACLLDPALSAALGLSEGSLLLGVLVLVAVGSLGTAAYRTVRIARRLRPGAKGGGES
jgi:CDP-diacylglycerol--glycerol-3-phosphate 3-phosphatidyltransferase